EILSLSLAMPYWHGRRVAIKVPHGHPIASIFCRGRHTQQHQQGCQSPSCRATCAKPTDHKIGNGSRREAALPGQPRGAAHRSRRPAIILRQFEQMVVEVRASGKDPTGRVSIALMPSVAALFAPSLVARMRERHPAVSLRISEGLTTSIVGGLLNGKFDLGL